MSKSQAFANINTAAAAEKKPEYQAIADMLRAMAAASSIAAERIAAMDLRTKNLAGCMSKLHNEASKKKSGSSYTMRPEEAINLVKDYYGLKDIPELTTAAIMRSHLSLMEESTPIQTAEDSSKTVSASATKQEPGKVVSLFDLI